MKSVITWTIALTLAIVSVYLILKLMFFATTIFLHMLFSLPVIIGVFVLTPMFYIIIKKKFIK